MQTFSIADDTSIVSLINIAKKKLIYIAPGVSEPISEAISSRLKDQIHIDIILDPDPEVCRLGYGTAEGLKLLQEAMENAGKHLRSQSGLRIGLIMSDDQLLIYSPTPLLIEAGPNNPSKPNAIQLGEQPIEQISKATAMDSQNKLSIAEIGKTQITQQKIQDTVDDLNRMPPKPYDLQRVQRIFSSKVQYMEIEVSGYRLAGRSVPLPKDLLVSDRETQNRLKNSYKLFDNPEELDVDIVGPTINKEGIRKENVKLRYGQKILEEDRRMLTERWLYPVKGFGMLLFREDRTRFYQEIEAFRERIQAYGIAIKKLLDGEDQKRSNLIPDGLVKAVMKSPPNRYIREGIDMENHEDISLAILDDIMFAYRGLCEGIDPKIKVVPKDVSYESLSDPLFRDAVEKALIQKKKKTLIKDLFSEYDAAIEKDC